MPSSSSCRGASTSHVRLSCTMPVCTFTPRICWMKASPSAMDTVPPAIRFTKVPVVAWALSAVRFLAKATSSTATLPSPSGVSPFTLSTTPSAMSCSCPMASATVCVSEELIWMFSAVLLTFSLNAWAMVWLPACPVSGMSAPVLPSTAATAAAMVCAPLASLTGMSVPAIRIAPWLSAGWPFTLTFTTASASAFRASASPTAFASAASPELLSVASIGTVITVASSSSSSNTSSRFSFTSLMP